MKNKLLMIIPFCACLTGSYAQKNDLPYYEIDDYPENYTSGLIAARLVDGLGYRFYWATDNLSDSNMDYRPGEEARTIGETIDHIYNLAFILNNAVHHKKTVFPVDIKALGYSEKRKRILLFIKDASGILRESGDEDFKSYNIIFEYKDGNKREYPFWNLLNGPVADAIWHSGQIASFRRSDGNPFNSNVNMLTGKVR